MKKRNLLYFVFVFVFIFLGFIPNVMAKKTITVHYYTADADRLPTYTAIKNYMGYTYNVSGYDSGGNGSVESQLSGSAAFVVHNHGAPGKQYLSGSTGIVGTGGNGSSWKSISSMSAVASKPLYIAIYYGCETGQTSSTYGNILSQTTSKFAKSAVAWTVSTFVNDVNLWNQYFFYYAKNNLSSTASNALTYADTTLASSSGAIEASLMKNYRVTSGTFGWTFTQMSM